ncbi:MAG TPA: adenylate/guanylate cyclase domain-containing protein [Bryobacteraceae bacterium]|nr:adenylate/guanylate cyclase domain-containing protein [Bryobacteraceae bacterium]
MPPNPETPPAADAVMVHVLFMDIVGASKRFTDDQPGMVKDLQTKVSQTSEYQRAHSRNELIAIPTGDGMALVFLDKIDSPVRCSLELSRALRTEESYKVRMGIHSGPVYIVEDINGQRNVSGAGINRAQRVMDCGDGDHILLSDTIAESLRQFREWNVAIKDIGDCKVKDGWQHVWSYDDGTYGNRDLPKKSKRYLMQRRRTLMMGLAALLFLAAAGAWFFYFRPPATKTAITYSIIVRRPSGETLVMAREMAFDAHYAIKVKFQTAQHGFLYLINEGPETAGVHTWRWLFPYPKVRNGSAEVASGQTVVSPEGQNDYFEMDEKSGAETVFAVWSLKEVPELERLRSSMFANSEVKFSAEQARSVQSFLESNTPPVTLQSEQGSTTLTAHGSYLVKKIILEHM